MKQKPTQHKLGDFMAGKGFYIVLFLCVAAIGISGYYLFSGLFAEPEGFGSEPSSVVSGQAELEGDQNPGQQTEETTPPAQDGAAASATEEEKSAESKQDTASQEKTTPMRRQPLLRPTSGPLRATWIGISAWRSLPTTPPWETGGPMTPGHCRRAGDPCGRLRQGDGH